LTGFEQITAMAAAEEEWVGEVAAMQLLVHSESVEEEAVVAFLRVGVEEAVAEVGAFLRVQTCSCC